MYSDPDDFISNWKKFQSSQGKVIWYLVHLPRTHFLEIKKDAKDAEDDVVLHYSSSIKEIRGLGWSVPGPSLI